MQKNVKKGVAHNGVDVEVCQQDNDACECPSGAQLGLQALQLT